MASKTPVKRPSYKPTLAVVGVVIAAAAVNASTRPFETTLVSVPTPSVTASPSPSSVAPVATPEPTPTTSLYPQMTGPVINQSLTLVHNDWPQVPLEYPVLHASPGGTGTFADPFSLRVPFFPASDGTRLLGITQGTRIYVPHVGYAIVEGITGQNYEISSTCGSFPLTEAVSFNVTDQNLPVCE